MHVYTFSYSSYLFYSIYLLTYFKFWMWKVVFLLAMITPFQNHTHLFIFFSPTFSLTYMTFHYQTYTPITSINTHFWLPISNIFTPSYSKWKYIIYYSSIISYSSYLFYSIYLLSYFRFWIWKVVFFLERIIPFQIQLHTFSFFSPTFSLTYMTFHYQPYTS